MALAILALPVLLLAGSPRAQDIYIYPAKGQSQAQQDLIVTNVIHGRSSRPDSTRAGPRLLPLTHTLPRTRPCHRRGTSHEARREAPHLERWVAP